jgi:GcrA cell cycle regulator
MRDATSFDWNADAIETLKTMLAAGRSSREIAEALGVTRNAVIGKSRRIGLNFAAPPGKPPKPRPSRRKPPPPKASFPFLRRPKPKPAGPVHFKDLEPHHCRWIQNAPSSQLYCGAERVEGSSYCNAHTRASYVPNSKLSRQLWAS